MLLNLFNLDDKMKLYIIYTNIQLNNYSLHILIITNISHINIT